MENPKFQIYKSSNKKFYFRLRAGNGQVILQSQGYKSKPAAKNGINSVRRNGTSVKNFVINQSRNKKRYFNLVSGNKEIIGSSQMYTRLTNCKAGIAAVKKNAKAPVEDLA